MKNYEEMKQILTSDHECFIYLLSQTLCGYLNSDNFSRQATLLNLVTQSQIDNLAVHYSKVSVLSTPYRMA